MKISTMWIKHVIWKRTTMCGSQFLQVWPTPIWDEICWSKPSGQIKQTIRHLKKLASVGVWKFGDPKTHNSFPHHDYPMTPGRTSANLCRTENHILFHLRRWNPEKNHVYIDCSIKWLVNGVVKSQSEKQTTMFDDEIRRISPFCLHGVCWLFQTHVAQKKEKSH